MSDDIALRYLEAILATHDIDLFREGPKYTARIWEEGKEIVEVTRTELLGAIMDAQLYLRSIRNEAKEVRQ